MANHTKRNLREVDDAAVQGGFSETQEARFASGDLETEQTGLSHHVVKPGKRQAFGHRHEEVEEVYVVIRGSGRVKLDDEVLDVDVLDAIRVGPEVARAFEGGPDGLEVIAFSPRRTDDRGEMLPDFWADE